MVISRSDILKENLLKRVQQTSVFEEPVFQMEEKEGILVTMQVHIGETVGFEVDTKERDG